MWRENALVGQSGLAMTSEEDGYHIGKCPSFVGQETVRRREGGGWTEREADGHKNSCYERARLPHSRGKWWTPESVDQMATGLNLRICIQQKLRETGPAGKKWPKLSESIAQASSLDTPRHHLQMAAMSPSRRWTPKPPLCPPHTHTDHHHHDHLAQYQLGERWSKGWEICKTENFFL